LLTEAVAQTIEAQFDLESLGPIVLKGKAAVMPVYALQGAKQ
jgi:class 3 adenylate cyclase